MIFFERFLYKLFIRIFYFLFKIASLFNMKAKKWIEGRKSSENLKFKSRDINKKLIWIHVSSLGEYEQGISVLKELNKQKKYQTAVSFFSSSGYEIIHPKNQHDFIFYFPLDIKKNAFTILRELKPSILLLVKYDYWYISLEIFKKNRLPIYVISAKIKKNFIAFKWYGTWFYSVIKSLDGLFIQDETSFRLLEKYNIKNYKITGDTRFDRVKELLKLPLSLDFIKKFKSDKKLLVAGSTWKKDDELLTKINIKNIRIILVPHEINKKYLLELKQKFRKAILYSEYRNKNIDEYEIIIVDVVGILTKIYPYADFAFVGGAFDKNGVHNILEPAVYGVPVFFGPNIIEYDEAKQLIVSEGGKIIKNSDELNFWLDKFIENDELKKKIGNNAQSMIFNHENSTKKIVKILKLSLN